jgi:hypothetical protein
MHKVVKKTARKVIFETVHGDQVTVDKEDYVKFCNGVNWQSVHGTRLDGVHQVRISRRLTDVNGVNRSVQLNRLIKADSENVPIDALGYVHFADGDPLNLRRNNLVLSGTH